MVNFSVRGPFVVSSYKGKGGRTITQEGVRRFWEEHGDYAGRRGCYVFGIRAGKGGKPAYVGMATKAFKKEVFAPHKLSRYQEFLADYGKGTPVVFLVVAPIKKGAPNVSQIEALEKFLIQVAVARNPDLLNIQGTKSARWSIAGVIRGGAGKPSKAAATFREFMTL
jgi:hypothetical protein